MKNSLSIRSYTKQLHSHSHEYHQIVLPFNGHIELEVEEYKGKVSVGEAIVIKAMELHSFKASEEAKFIVADMMNLPSTFTSSSIRKFSASEPLHSFIQYIEKQLQASITAVIEKQLFELFFELLSIEPRIGRIDRRIENAIALIHDNLSLNHSIAELAEVSCLGQTQFKKLFKDCTGMSASHYITKVKMEKARALLSHTDFPITRIALEVGYKDSTAFTRRFTQLFSQPPSKFCKYN